MADLTTKRLAIAQHGINLIDNPINFEGRFTPYMKNFHLDGGILKKFSGYSAYPNTNENNLMPIGMGFSGGGGIFDFHSPTGEVYSIIATRRDMFLYYNNKLWQITPGRFVDDLADGWTDAHGNLTTDHYNTNSLHGVSLRTTSSGAVSSDSAKIAYKNIDSLDVSSYTHVSGWIKVSGISFGSSDGYLILVLSESADGAKSGDYVEVAIPYGFGYDVTDGDWLYFSSLVDLSALDAVISIGLWNDSGITWSADDVVYLKDISCNTPMSISYNVTQRLRGSQATDTNEFTDGKALVLTNNKDDLVYFDGDTARKNDFSADENCKALWKLEEGSLTEDAIGNNNFENKGAVADSEYYKEGLTSANLGRVTDGYLRLTTAGQDSGLPLKYDEANKTFSIAFWMRLNAIDINQYILGKANAFLVLMESADNKLIVNISPSLGVHNRLTHDTPLKAETWYHVTITYDNSDSATTIRIWDDSAQAIHGTDASGTTSDIYINLSEWNLGTASGSLAFGGNLDEVAIFDDILTDDEADEIRSDTYNIVATEKQRFKTLVHTFDSFTNCKEITEFWNYFMMCGYVLDGGSFLQSIEHSGAGDIDDHTSVSSGNYWLSDAVGSILRIVKLKQALIIFTSRSIIRGDFYGSATKFTFRVISSGIGLLGPDAICSTGKTIFFLGSDNKIYSYELNSDILEVGRNISSDLVILPSTTNYEYRAFYDLVSKRVYFGVTRSGWFKGYSLNLKGTSALWEYYEFEDEIDSFLSGFGFSEQSYSFDSPKNIFLTSYGKVYKLSNESDVGDFTMNSTAITCEYQTEDISINQEFDYARWQEFLFTAKSSVSSSSVVVEYSIDNGDSWTAVDESPIYLENDEWKTYLVHFDVVSRVIRIRFTNTSKDLQIKSNMFIRFISEGEKEAV